jgi:hypothetical protein
LNKVVALTAEGMAGEGQHPGVARIERLGPTHDDFGHPHTIGTALRRWALCRP